MIKKSNVYTRTGDLGTTALIGGTRVKKNHARVEAYGDVDELNSQIGRLETMGALDAPAHEFLNWVQNKLFDLGCYLATDTHGDMVEAQGFGQDTISKIEHEIDKMDNNLPPLRAFILPGGCPAAAFANISRAVCRRVERRIIALSENIWVDPNVIRFINRLSDYLFVLGRNLNLVAGVEERTWRQETENR